MYMHGYTHILYIYNELKNQYKYSYLMKYKCIFHKLLQHFKWYTISVNDIHFSLRDYVVIKKYVSQASYFLQNIIAFTYYAKESHILQVCPVCTCDSHIVSTYVGAGAVPDHTLERHRTVGEGVDPSLWP